MNLEKWFFTSKFYWAIIKLRGGHLLFELFQEFSRRNSKENDVSLKFNWVSYFLIFILTKKEDGSLVAG